MPHRVILIGDSIRMGYQNVVHRELEGLTGGRVAVWAPEENGGNSRNVLAHLEEWVLSRQPDIVHINCGLHDLRKEFVRDAAARPAIAAVDIEEYAVNVRQILTKIRQATSALPIWATTTPVNQVWHHAVKGFDRWEEDVRAYNQAATAIAAELGVPIDDLCGLVMRAGRDAHLAQDGVHFTPEGYQLLGKAVARAIAAYLPFEPASDSDHRPG